MFLGWNN